MNNYLSPEWIPDSFGPKKRRIIKEYIRIRLQSVPSDQSIVTTITVNLGYKVDKNHSNDFVRRSIKEFLRDVTRIDVSR